METKDSDRSLNEKLNQAECSFISEVIRVRVSLIGLTALSFSASGATCSSL